MARPEQNSLSIGAVCLSILSASWYNSQARTERSNLTENAWTKALSSSEQANLAGLVSMKIRKEGH